jgi:ribonuclease T2
MPFQSRTWIACLLAVAFVSNPAEARFRKKKAATDSGFSYYLLVLSYAPDFCNQPEGRKDPRECGPGRRLGFVVHGLWPQGENSRGPERCGNASPVSQSIVQTMLRYIPTESLIQHEWASHGTCSGLSSADYFAAIRRARDAVKIPADLDQPTQSVQLRPADIESKVASANPSYPRAAFRTSCYRDDELQEIRICLNKDLSPRPCGPSAGQCPASRITLLPVR